MRIPQFHLLSTMELVWLCIDQIILIDIAMTLEQRPTLQASNPQNIPTQGNAQLNKEYNDYGCFKYGLGNL